MMPIIKITDNKKFCKRCNQLLELEKFPLSKWTKHGRGTYCNSCMRESYPKNKETNKIYNQNKSEKQRAYYLKIKFGISIEDYKNLLEKQNNKCAICGEKELSLYNKKIKTLAVDHCHKTGKVRGLLCMKCNTAIGSLKENVEILDKAKTYLMNHEEKIK